MNTNVEDINQEIKDIVFGYVNNYNNNNKIKCINIPIVIIHIILFYYYDNFKFNKDIHGDNIKFISNKIVKINKNNHCWSTCIFGKTILNKDCNKFTIHLKWKKASCFFIGFITSKIEKSIKNWNEPFCHITNCKNFIGIQVNEYCVQFDLSDEYNHEKTLNYQSKQPFNDNDTFIFIYNFILNKLTIYHNNKIADIISINYHYKQITPIFSLYGSGNQEIEITKCFIS